MGNILKKPKVIVFLLTIVVFSAMVFYYSQFPNQKPIEIVSAQSINGVLRVHPTNSRYFTDDSGKAIYLTGSHVWDNLQDIESKNSAIDPYGFDYDTHLDWLASYGFNHFRLWTFEATEWFKKRDYPHEIKPHPWLRTGPGIARDNLPKFDLNRHNQAYFDRVRQRVIKARDKGFYVTVMLFQGIASTQRTGAWETHPFHLDNNINSINGDTNNDGLGQEIHTLPMSQQILDVQEAYVLKIVDTLNDLDNVMYEIGNEIYVGSVSWQDHMYNLIVDYEMTKPKQHLVGISTIAGVSPNGQWEAVGPEIMFSRPSPWITVNDRSPWPDYINNPPINDGQKILISDSDHLGRNDVTASWVWKSFVNGLHPIHMDIGNHDWEQDTDPSKYESIRKAMQYSIQYANKVSDLAAMIPSDSSSHCSTMYCLRNPGQEYLIYQPNSGSFTVNLEAGDYNYEWFDPSLGVIAETGTLIASGGNKSFLPPFSGDAVLYLRVVACLLPDFNCDQNIDLADLTTFKNLWGQTDSSADFNQDSFINTQDFGIMMSTWQ